MITAAGGAHSRRCEVRLLRGAHPRRFDPRVNLILVVERDLPAAAGRLVVRGPSPVGAHVLESDLGQAWDGLADLRRR